MLHLLQAVEDSLKGRNFYSALMVSLALPDICGWIDKPSDSGSKRYQAFFAKYMADQYRVAVGAKRREVEFLGGKDFYALRCSFLHQGKDEIVEQQARNVLDRFQFIAPPDKGVVHRNLFDGIRLQLQVDIFCGEILEGCRMFLGSIVPGSEQHERLETLGRITKFDGFI